MNRIADRMDPAYHSSQAGGASSKGAGPPPPFPLDNPGRGQPPPDAAPNDPGGNGEAGLLISPGLVNARAAGLLSVADVNRDIGRRRGQIADWLRLFVKPGQVVELRALHVSADQRRPHAQSG